MIIKKKLRDKIFFLIISIIIIFFYWHNANKPIYFQKLDKTIKPSKKEFLPNIIGYAKPIKTIDLTNKQKPFLFVESESNYPHIYGFHNRFIADLTSEVIVFDQNKIIDSIINRHFGYNKISVDKNKAYIFLNDELYTYDKTGFKKKGLNFDFLVSRFDIDKNNLYVGNRGKKDDELLVLNKNLKDYAFYKDLTYDKFDLVPINYAKDGYIYFRDKNFTLKAISVDNDVNTITSKKYFAKFKGFYILKDKEKYTLYSFPKTKVITFTTTLDFNRFFILKDALYLMDTNTILAKVNLKTKKLHILKPTKIDGWYFDVNDDFLAFAKNDTITIVDENLNVVKRYKINLLPDVYSYTIDKNNTAYIKDEYVYLNGKKIFKEKDIDTDLAFDNNRLAIISYDDYKNILYFDIFKDKKHIKSYTIKPKENLKYINSTIFYRNIIIISCSSKTLIIKNGKILKEISYKYPHGNLDTLKKVKNNAYLSYNNKLKEIDLNTLKVKYIASNGYRYQKGDDFLMYKDKLLSIALNIDFKDRKISIIPTDSIYHYFALKNYAIVWFKNELNAIYAFSKEKTYKLILASKHNKIFNVLDLEDNSFAVVDGFGVKIINLDLIER